MNKSDKLNLKLHNRFDFYLNGEHVAEAENVVLNSAYTQFNNSNAQFKLQLGNGTGTPSASDTGLFNRLHTLTLTNSFERMSDTMVKISGTKTFNTNEINGTYTEVGLSAYSNVSHAMITDSQGNPISLVKTTNDTLTLTFILYIDFTEYFNSAVNNKIWDRPFITSNGYLSGLTGETSYRSYNNMTVLSEAYIPNIYVSGHSRGVGHTTTTGNLHDNGKVTWNNTVIAPRKRVYSIAQNVDNTYACIGLLPITNLLPTGLQLNGITLDAPDGVKDTFLLPYTAANNPVVSVDSVPVDATFIYEDDYDIYGAPPKYCDSNYAFIGSSSIFCGDRDDMYVLHTCIKQYKSNYYSRDYLTSIQKIEGNITGFEQTTKSVATSTGNNRIPSKSFDKKLLSVSCAMQFDYWAVRYILARQACIYLINGISLENVTINGDTLTDLWYISFSKTSSELIISSKYNGVNSTNRFSYSLEGTTLTLVFIEKLSDKLIYAPYQGTGPYSVGTKFIMMDYSLTEYTITGLTTILDKYFNYIGSERRIVFDGLTNSKLEYLDNTGEVTNTYPIELPANAIAFDNLAYGSPFVLIPFGNDSYIILCSTETNSSYNYYEVGFLALDKINNKYYMPYGWPAKNGSMSIKNSSPLLYTTTISEFDGDTIITLCTPLFSKNWKISKGKCYAKLNSAPAASSAVTTDINLPYFPKDENFNLEVSATYKLVNPS